MKPTFEQRGMEQAEYRQMATDVSEGWDRPPDPQTPTARDQELDEYLEGVKSRSKAWDAGFDRALRLVRAAVDEFGDEQVKLAIRSVADMLEDAKP